MHIEEVHLLSPSLDRQEVFYGETLGLAVDRIAPAVLEVTCGENKLIFHQSEAGDYYYHFAFLIPTCSLESAIEFAASKGLELLLNKGETITHFDSGRAIYFHDGDQNIAEFIERPLVDYPAKESFNIQDLIKLNEIGLPTPEPKRKADELCSSYGIIPIAPEKFNDVFCWVGDHEGVIIVVKEGRGWLPTGRLCIASPFYVKYREGATDYAYACNWPLS